jgi:hypothetical protein
MVGSPVTLAGGASLLYAGTGTTTSSTSGVSLRFGELNGGGTINATNSTNITVAGAVSITANRTTSGSSSTQTPGTSDAAAGTDWDYLNLTDSTLTLTGPITLRIDALQADGVTRATLSSQNSFDPVAGNYHMLFVRTAGISGFTAGTFQVQDSVEGFGVFGTGNAFTPAAGQFWVSLEGNDLYINCAAVPEPSSVLMVGVACCGGFVLRRRRKLAPVEHVAQSAAFA